MVLQIIIKSFILLFIYLVLNFIYYLILFNNTCLLLVLKKPKKKKKIKGTKFSLYLAVSSK